MEVYEVDCSYNGDTNGARRYDHIAKSERVKERIAELTRSAGAIDNRFRSIKPASISLRISVIVTRTFIDAIYRPLGVIVQDISSLIDFFLLFDCSFPPLSLPYSPSYSLTSDSCSEASFLLILNMQVPGDPPVSCVTYFAVSPELHATLFYGADQQAASYLSEGMTGDKRGAVQYGGERGKRSCSGDRAEEPSIRCVLCLH
jgi:hypothetical protein